MSKAKVIIVYESYHHFNTEKVARIIAQRLQADLYRSSQVKIPTLLEYSAIGIGTGIYWGKPHKKIQLLLNKLPNLTGKKSFLFITSGIIYKHYTRRIINKISHKMAEKGLAVIDFLSIKGWDTFGPLALLGGINKGHPDLEDLHQAELFANRVLNEL